MFDRVIKFIGEDSFNKIKNSKVLVIGLGGVGGYAVESLVRSGVSNIIIVDYDRVDITNLNRQIITNLNNIDCCDSIDVKCELIRACLDKNIGFISSMGTGNKLDPSMLKVMDIRETSYDPIAKKIRKYVNDNKIRGKIPVVCSIEKNNRFDGDIPSFIFVPAVSGLLCANYIIKSIIKK